jgi:hypothetical protein
LFGGNLEDAQDKFAFTANASTLSAAHQLSIPSASSAQQTVTRRGHIPEEHGQLALASSVLAPPSFHTALPGHPRTPCVHSVCNCSKAY